MAIATLKNEGKKVQSVW